MARVLWLSISAVLAGCGDSGSSRTAGTASAAADSAVLAASAAPSVPRVSNVMIGRRIGAGNRIIEPTFQFGPRDTVHVSVATEGAGDTVSLTAAWRSQAGEIIQQSEQRAVPGENTSFLLAPTKGLAPGTYKVVLFMGRDSVDTKVFVVQK